MSGWATAELDAFGGSDEIAITSFRPDGTPRRFVTIWIARLGDQLYVRSAYGPDNGWYRRAKAAGLGRIRNGGRERDVAFEAPGSEVAEPLSSAYHAKYDRYGAALVGTVVSADAVACTLRLVPR